MTHYERMMWLAELTDGQVKRFADRGECGKANEYRELSVIVKEAAKGMTVEEAVAP